jgi:glycosyltransferase involved in cell wall biosynthesis
MKITIITSTLNSEKTISYTLSSVFNQTYKNIEHIFVDGGSTDGTINIIKNHKLKNKKFFFLKGSKIYEALNFGIKKSTGDYILILNSDDILDNPKIISKVAKIIKKNKTKQILLGSVTYFNEKNFNIINRVYPSAGFKKWMLYYGNMPPHPGAFIPRDIAIKNLYNEKFTIASDFDLFLSLFKSKKYNYKIINMVITRMKTGGVSGKNILSHIRSSSEIYQSLKSKKIFASYLLIYSRFIVKFLQKIFLNRKKNYNFIIDKYYEKLIKYDFKIITKPKILNFKKNFVLSELNLAFLGSLASKEVRLYKQLIHWPDGIFSKKIAANIDKLQGSVLLKRIKISNKIKQIVVFGYLHDLSKKYLEEKFNRPVKNYPLPYGTIEIIKKKFLYKLQKNELYFLTLPTPKQEQFADYLSSKSRYFKIICIGGGLNIVSGLEKSAPPLFDKIEFIWRLQYDTKRRLKRLIKTYAYYIVGRFFLKTFHNRNYKILS